MLHAGTANYTAQVGSVNAGGQQYFHFFFFFSNALSPAREAGGADGQLGLKVRLTPKDVLVRVLRPGVENRVIGGIEGVLQVQKPGD